MPQTVFSPPDDTIKSPRDLLHRPPTSTPFLKFLHNSSRVNAVVTIPFRITHAWSCAEENEETIVYIEAILPEKEEVFPEVPVTEKTDTVEGKHKLTRFLVRFEDYMQLMERQKQQLEHQELDALNQALIGRMDKVHFELFTGNMTPEMQAELKESALAHGLFLNSANTKDEELLKLIEDHRNGNLGA